MEAFGGAVRQWVSGQRKEVGSMPAYKMQPTYDAEKEYLSLPEDVRAELIDGNLVYCQAAPSRIHQAILGELHAVIHAYIRGKKGPCRVYPAPFSVKLKEERQTIVEPDISVICDPDKLTDRGCTGAPDWIIEIASPSNARHDYIRKLELYADAGVREYWIVDPEREGVLVYRLGQERFQLEAYTFQDQVRAGIYEDFSIDFAELEFE